MNVTGPDARRFRSGYRRKQQRPPMTKILYRYILREITYPFILALFVATFALMMGKILQLTELVINKGVGFWNISKLILFMMPGLLLFTIPLAFLIAILTGIGRLSRDNEWTVMKNAGLSLYQLSRPVFALAVVAFVMTTATSLFLFPEGNQASRNLIIEIARQKASAGIKEKVFNDDFSGIVLYADEISVDGESMEGLLLFDDRIQSEPCTIIAQKGYLVASPDSPAVTLRLENGSIHSVNPSLKNYKKIDFSTYDVSLELQMSVADASKFAVKKIQEMTFLEMASQLGSPEPSLPATRIREMKIELHKRFAIPLSCLIFAVVGMPLGITPSRSARLRGFTTALAVVVAYYLLTLSGTALGETGRLPPAVGAWVPNAVFAAAGAILFVRKAEEKSLDWDLWQRVRSFLKSGGTS
jgi:lipopolysaccharide export system permease protein